MSTPPVSSPLPHTEPAWKTRCWKYTSLFISVMAMQSLGVVSIIPHLEKVFIDLLGTREVLPILTQWVMRWSDLQREFILLELFLVLALVILLWVSKAHLAVRTILAVIMVLLALHLFAIIPAIAVSYSRLMASLKP